MRVAVVVLLVALTVGCGSASDTVKPTPLTPIDSAFYISSVWSRGVSFSVPDHFAVLKPVLADHIIYVADPKGQIAALSAGKGNVKWRRDIKVQLTGGLSYGAGMLLAGTAAGEVLAMQASDGRLLWRRQVSSEVLAAPTVSGGMVLVRAVDDQVFGLDAQDGKQRWVFKRSTPALTLHGTSAPAVSGDKVFVGLADGALVALGLYDGRLLWETQIAEPKGRSELEHMVDIDSDPVVVDDTVYTVAYQGHAAAVDVQSGRELWTRDFSAYIGLRTTGDRLFAVNEQGDIWALDRGTGATVWKQDKLAYRRVTAPAVLDGDLIVADFEGYLHWLDADTGRIVGRYRVDDKGVTAPPFTDGSLVYALSDGGRLVALRVSTHPLETEKQMKIRGLKF
jgi:outer membrane protein assembly factor BamB